MSGSTDAGAVVSTCRVPDRLVAVVAHPDDESIACGGLLARCADMGAHVSIVCATHGENRQGTRDPDWFATRPRELSDAARVLGVREVVVYDYGDGFLPWVDRAEFGGRLQRELERLRADVVITFGLDGLYWHPDHIALHEIATSAVQDMGEDGPSLYYVTMPRGMMRRLVDRYGGGGSGDLLLGIADPDAYGVGAARPTLAVDVSAQALRKLKALKCHRTQVAGTLLDRIPEGHAAELFPVEHFHRAPHATRTTPFVEALASACDARMTLAPPEVRP